MENQMKKDPSTSIRRPRRSRPPAFQYYVVTTACCIVLVVGFFLAARQHFSSMEYSLQNSRLRHQVDQLQAEKRKLLVTREVSLSPIELRKAARRIGFMDTPLNTAEPSARQDRLSPKAAIDTVDQRRSAIKTPNKVVKTVITAPVVKSPAPERQARREANTPKKDRT